MKKLPTKLSALLLSLLWVVNSTDTHAGSVAIAGSFGSFNVGAKSLSEMKWDTVIKQQYDFSCGSAAVATLLTYHYDRTTTEAEVFKAMIEEGDRDKIRAQGFSMLDMKRYLDDQGLNADGFRMSLDDFIEIGVPAITLIDTGGYKHFVVIKGIEDGNVLVGDPAVGTVVVPRTHFQTLWSGIVLGAREHVQLARQNFNSEKDWRIRPDSPLKKGISRSGVGTMLLALPAANELGK